MYLLRHFLSSRSSNKVAQNPQNSLIAPPTVYTFLNKKNSLPINLDLIFAILQFEISSLMNLIFSPFQT
jgi:hypothetical protein